MDVAGARALEQRIAHGKPVDEINPELPIPDRPRVEAPLQSPVPLPEIDVVYLQPRPLPGKPRPWVFVRAPDGRLRRAR
jgi:hypothetical protein